MTPHANTTHLHRASRRPLVPAPSPGALRVLLLMLCAGVLLPAMGAAGCRTSTGTTDATIPDAELERLNRSQQEANAERAQARRRAVETAARASVAADEGRPDEAIELYRKAIGLWNRMPAAYNNLGTLLLARGNRVEAAEAFRVAADLDPRDARPLTNLATLWTDIGYPEDGQPYFLEALQRDPNDLIALRGIVATADLLKRANEQLLEQVRRALLLETDPAWREYLSRQRFRIEQAIDTY